MYYLNSRYYDPNTCRFINADDVSILSEGKDIINGLNLYIYCGNNPIMNTDDSGQAWWDWLIGVFVIVAAVALSVVTAGIGTAITGVLGGGLFASILGGAVGGAISGAIFSAGISIASQGISNGFNNINWGQVGISTLIGAVSGFVLGGIGGAVRYFASTTKLYRAVNSNEMSSIIKNKKFMSQGFSEGKYFKKKKKDVLKWASRMYGNKPFNIVKIRIPTNQLNRALTNGLAYYWSRLDTIGPAYYISTDLLSKIVKSITQIF